MRATQDGHLAIAQLLLDHRADVHARDMHGASALMDAAWHSHEDVARLLLDRGADPNVKDQVGTPLMQAVHTGSLAWVGLLLERGADVHANWYLRIDHRCSAGESVACRTAHRP